MPPTPSPAPLAPVPLEWWQNVALFSPVAVLLAAALAAFINWQILRQRTQADIRALEQKRESDRNALDQKTAADSRAEWWRRAQWALEQALSKDEDTKALGLATLDVLARSELARKEELELFDIAWEVVNGKPGAAPEAAGEPGEATISIFIADGDPVDLQNLGDFLRQQAELYDQGAVDSGTDLGDNEPTEPKAKEEDQ
ncbi:MAG TPA: hypothetical protein VF885_15585 [Arthrobacter sp.]